MNTHLTNAIIRCKKGGGEAYHDKTREMRWEGKKIDQCMNCQLCIYYRSTNAANAF